MIRTRTALPIEEIAVRLGGEVIAPNMVRAPGVGVDHAGRSLMVTRSSADCLKISGESNAFRQGRFRRRCCGECLVQAKISGSC